MAYVFAEFGQTQQCPPGYVYRQGSANTYTGKPTFDCLPPAPDTQANCPPGFRPQTSRSGTTCVPLQPATCPLGTVWDQNSCRGVGVSPQSQADCAEGLFFHARKTFPGTRTIPQPAMCLKTPPSIFPGLPGFAFPDWLSPSISPAAPPVIGVQAPRPTNLSADWKSGQCPSGWVFRPGNLLNCLPPRNCGLSQAAACVLPLPVEAGPPRPPSITSDELKRGDVFYSKDPCPQGFVKIDAGTKNEHCRRLPPAMVDDSGLFSPPLTPPCQTGYVLVADQCVKQPPMLEPPVEVKTAGITSWASTNWKWLAALAVVGAVGYGWAKRKPVEA